MPLRLVSKAEVPSRVWNELPAIQTYSDGEEAEWIEQDPEGEEPAPSVAVLAAATEEETAATDTTSADEGTSGEAAAATDDDGEHDGQATLALVLSIVALVLGGGALAYALVRSRRPTA